MTNFEVRIMKNELRIKYCVVLFWMLAVGCGVQKNAMKSPFAQSIEAHRTAYKAEFLHTPNSPLDSAEVQQLRFFEPDKAYRVKANFTRTEEAEPFQMATYSGVEQPYVQFGTARFELFGESHTLAIYQSINLRRMPQYRTYLFLPFKDRTNGKSTYGGGRYMDLQITDIENGKLVLDFNKAHNPYCAYSEGYNCPIPPLENHLTLAIEAGEKTYASAQK